MTCIFLRVGGGVKESGSLDCVTPFEDVKMVKMRMAQTKLSV